jgi:hypothetical protein
MNAWFPLLKARMVLFFAAVLVVAGLLPVLYFVALFVWQLGTLFLAGSWVALPATLLFSDHALLAAGKAAPVLAFIPEFPWAWLMNPDALLPVHQAVAWMLGGVHVGIVFALIGLAVMAFGALGVLRQKAVIRAHQQQEEDRLRRMRDYRQEGGGPGAFEGRREPFIGPGGIAGKADRRAA